MIPTTPTVIKEIVIQHSNATIQFVVMIINRGRVRHRPMIMPFTALRTRTCENGNIKKNETVLQ